jgi:hypothetical protein
MDDPILHALEHPPRHDAPRDPALVAGVMGRVRALPTATERRQARRQWIAAGALAAVVAVAWCLLPVDPFALLAIHGGGANDVAADAALAAALVAVVAIVSMRGRADAA